MGGKAKEFRLHRACHECLQIQMEPISAFTVAAIVKHMANIGM